MSEPSRRARILTLALGLALLAIGVAAVLSHRGVHPAATNRVTTGSALMTAGPHLHFCQGGERVPAGTKEVRASIGSVGRGAPRIELTVRDRGGAVRAGGGDGARWSRHAVVVPLRAATAQDVAGRVCIRLAPAGAGAQGGERVRVRGQEPEELEAGTLQQGRVRFEYLSQPATSWWAFGGTVLDRIGRGHAWSGRSVAWSAALLTLVAVVLACSQLVGARRTAWACALVAVANACSWSLVMPAFQVPDEQIHYAYSEYLAQHDRPPVPALADEPSASQRAALDGLAFEATQFHAANGTIWTATEQRRLDRDLAFDASRGDGNGGANSVGGEPPLFYALQTIPYRIASGGDVLDRLALMRLLSALLAGVTVLFVYLFLREALPAMPWTWSVGALVVAFQPMFASISGGMNSDALLYAASAALFYLLARAFRRGLTPRLAVALGAAMAVGLLTKWNFGGLLPGAAAGLAVVALRGRRPGEPLLPALRLPALALAIALAPALLEVALNVTVWDRPAIGARASGFSPSGVSLSLGSGLAYVSQFYVVGLPGLTHYLSGFPLRDVWLLGFVGTFGWVDTFFRQLVVDLAALPLALLAAGAAATLARERETLRRRREELLAYAGMAAIFMLFVAAASYIVYRRFGDSVAQVRYLFPLLALYGALVVLATRAGGRRWAPVIGTAIVALAIAHDVFAQLLVVARYYA